MEKVLDRPSSQPVARKPWLTPQEIESLTQPLYEESLADLSAYWKRRFEEQRPKAPKSPK